MNILKAKLNIRKFVIIFLLFVLSLGLVSGQSLQEFDFEPDNLDQELAGGDYVDVSGDFVNVGDDDLPLSIVLSVDSDGVDDGQWADIMSEVDGEFNEDSLVCDSRVEDDFVEYVCSVDGVDEPVEADSDQEFDLEFETVSNLAPNNYDLSLTVESTPGVFTDTQTVEDEETSVEDNEVMVEGEAEVSSVESLTVEEPDTGDFVIGIAVSSEEDVEVETTLDYTDFDDFDSDTAEVFEYNTEEGSWSEIEEFDITPDSVEFTESVSSSMLVLFAEEEEPAPSLPPQDVTPEDVGVEAEAVEQALEAVAEVGALEQGQRAEISVPEQAATSTQSVSVTSSQDSQNTQFSVFETEEAPDEIEVEPENEVYRYQNFEWEDLEEVEEATIQFTVEDEFVEDAEQISLERLEEDGWTTLETSLEEEQNDEYLFEAETPGFSYFAVTSETAEDEEEEIENLEIDVTPEEPTLDEEIEIIVTDQEGEPVSDAEIQLDGQVEETEEDGTITFVPEEEQEYHLDAQIDGELLESTSFNVQEDDEDIPPGLTGQFLESTTSPIGIIIILVIMLGAAVYFNREKIRQKAS